MSKIAWDTTGSRRYEAGVDRGVFYPANGPGAAWNGLTAVKESPSDDALNVRYVDGIKTRSARRPGSFSGTIEAFTYPDSLYDNVLSQRINKNFGMSYRVKTDDGYKIHIVYNILLVPSDVEHSYEDPSVFSWEFTTLPIAIPGARATAHLVIDTSATYSWTTEALEAILYGSDQGSAYLPSPTEIIDIFNVNSILVIVDNGDGSFTATGPDEAVSLLDPTTFQISWPSVVYIDADTYEISSL